MLNEDPNDEMYLIRGRGKTAKGEMNWSTSIACLYLGRNQPHHGSVFNGRPDLASSLHSSVEHLAEGVTKGSFKSMLSHFTQLFKCFDELDHAATKSKVTFIVPNHILELGSDHWKLFTDWLMAKDGQVAHTTYFHCKRILDGAAIASSAQNCIPDHFPLPPNPFPNQQRLSAQHGLNEDDVFDVDTIRKASATLYYQIAGTHQRLQAYKDGDSQPTGHWAWVHDFLSSSTSTNWDLTDTSSPCSIGIESGFCGLFRTNPRAVNARWFVPMFKDILAPFAYTMLRHGWNQSTTLEINPESWHRPNAKHPTQSVCIYSKKMRGKANEQVSFSHISRDEHTYRVLLNVQEWTKPLRDALVIRLTVIRREMRDHPSVERFAELNLQLTETIELSKSFWLYMTERGTISALDGNVRYQTLNDIFDAAGLSTDDSSFRFSQSVCRNSWAVFSYESSGFNAMVSQIALGHKSMDVLCRYLDQKVVRNRNRREFFQLQTYVIASMQVGSLNIAEIRRLMEGRKLTEREAILVLSGDAPLSRQGFACANSKLPDKSVEPLHQPGTDCLGQNCSQGCSKAFVTHDSLIFTASHILRLSALRESMPALSWAGSSNADELIVAEEIFALFSEAHQAKAMKAAKRHLQPNFFTKPSKLALKLSVF